MMVDGHVPKDHVLHQVMSSYVKFLFIPLEVPLDSLRFIYHPKDPHCPLPG